MTLMPPFFLTVFSAELMEKSFSAANYREKRDPDDPVLQKHQAPTVLNMPIDWFALRCGHRTG
jgi:hypothetical protein